jgi:hypothetical protein
MVRIVILISFRAVSQAAIIGMHNLENVQESECTDSLYLYSKMRLASNSLVQVTAKDKTSGDILRCEAKVGVVERLEIRVRYRQIYVDNNFRLTVLGYDADGNVFTTLDGFLFDWRIEHGTEYAAHVAVPETRPEL